MSAFVTAFAVFVCVSGGAFAGRFLAAALPRHHLDESSKDVIKLVTGLIATLSALVLGLLIASAKSTFDEVDDGFRQTAARIILLDRTLAQYGPETRDVRDLLRTTYAARIDRLFPDDGSAAETIESRQATDSAETVEAALRALSPATETQRSMSARAITILDELEWSRWLAVERAGGSLPAPLLVVLTFWLAAMFASFALFAPRNPTAMVALLVGALSVSTSIFLIEEMNRPLEGILRTPSEPMYHALSLLGG